MTIVTIEIENGKDISNLKQYLSKEGYKFDVDENNTYSHHTEEYFSMLNERYQEYLDGREDSIDDAEVNREIDELVRNRKSGL